MILATVQYGFIRVIMGTRYVECGVFFLIFFYGGFCCDR